MTSATSHRPAERDWNASWIWHPGGAGRNNFYVYARRVFELTEIPQQATAYMTAGALYKLYVNGQYAGRGPNPSDPSRYYYDVRDLTGKLRAGTNVIALVGYMYDEESPAILKQNWGPGGLLFELTDGAGTPLVATDDSWRITPAPPWDTSTAINCPLLGDYKEAYDVRKEIPGWMEPGFDDAGWDAPAVLGKPPVEPWTRLVEREIPFLGGELLHPIQVAWETASVTYCGAPDWESHNDQVLAPDGPHRREADEPARMLKTHDDFTPSLTLDFGTEVSGYPEIRLEDGCDGGIIDVLYAEDAFFCRVDRFHLQDGPQTLRPFNRRTFRYMKLQFPSTPREVQIGEVSCRQDVYPSENRGAFSCSDDRLNAIWEVGRTTIRMNMLDHFTDCPWRERTLYGGDIWAENLIAQYCFGDPRMTRKCLRQLFHIQSDDGFIPPWGPYRGCHASYVAWAAYTGLTLTDHYRHTGDRELLEEFWPNLVRLLDFALGRIEEDPHGVIPVKRRVRGTTEEVTRYDPSQNFPFHYLMVDAAAAAREIGREEDAQRWEAAAPSYAESIRRHLTDPETGLVRAFTESGPGTPTCYDSAQLLLSGLPDAGAGRVLAERMFGPEVQPIQAPFHGMHTLMGLFRYGEDGRALDFARSYWGGMLDRGAVTYWDNFSTEWPDRVLPDRQTSLCHGWAAAPAYAFPAYVLGVRPETTAFETVRIEPHPGGLAWARGSVPTPQGDVEVDWRKTATRFELEAEVPEGCGVVFSLPAFTGRPNRVWHNGERVEVWQESGRLLLKGQGGAQWLVVAI